MDKTKFAIFILSHARADRVITYKELERSNYSGATYIIIDNEDPEADKYEENYSGKVIVFDKAAYAKTMDVGDNFKKRNSVVYARNASFDIAAKLGLDCFLQLDDDYNIFSYSFDSNDQFRQRRIKNLDRVLDAMMNLYFASDIAALAMAQRGEFIGGIGAGIFSKTGRSRRKAMNTFFLSPHRRFDFQSRMNDDVTTYVYLGSQGKVFMTTPQVAINQIQTQDNKGGLTDMYLESGTFVKSFYTVMYSPSSVKISMMGIIHPRLHHFIDWEKSVPSIIRESHRKQLHK